MPPMKAEGPVPAGRWVGAPSVYPGVQLRPRAAFHEHVSPVGPSTADSGPVSLRRTLGGPHPPAPSSRRAAQRLSQIWAERKRRADVTAPGGGPRCGADDGRR